MTEYPRDTIYGPLPRWGRLYDRFCPMFTCGVSRHVKVIAQDCLRDLKSPIRAMLWDWEPDHWASSMEHTVVALWKARAEVHRLREKYEPAKLARDKAKAMARIEAIVNTQRREARNVNE